MCHISFAWSRPKNTINDHLNISSCTWKAVSKLEKCLRGKNIIRKGAYIVLRFAAPRIT